MKRVFLTFAILLSAVYVLFGGSAIAATVDQGSNSFLVAQADTSNRDLRDRFDRGSRDGRVDQGSDGSHPGPKNFMGKTGLTSCSGYEYALCASSTCKPTGKKITVKEDGGKTTREYEEAACKCPIITKEIAEANGVALTGLAAVNEGNMQGSCAPPGPGKVWSYFGPITVYPQESTKPAFKPRAAVPLTCPADSKRSGVNCWNYQCTIDKGRTNGAKTATCFCPIGEGYIGHPTTSSEGFATMAGGYFNDPSRACNMLPVSGPIPGSDAN